MEKFSIIIPTLNNLKYLVPCINTIEETVSQSYEIIVVANACSANTAKVVKALGHTVVELSENEGFAKACNIGAETATGDILVFLNDDTLPGPKWLERLHACYKYFNKSVPGSAPIGAVGPVSNYVAGKQQLRSQQPMDYSDTAQVVPQLPLGRWEVTGFLSGFCLLTPHKIFDSLGGFDESFTAGCEDVAYVHQLTLKGYSSVIAFDSYVYHKGSVTLDKEEFQYLKRGTKQKVEFNSRYRIKGPQKLAVVYRAKIEDAFFADIFDKSLARSASFADGIFILDDNSPYNIDAIVEKYTAQGKIARCERFTRELGETRDRGLLYQWVCEAGYDWVFSVDSDEIVEDKFTREYADRLMHPYNPEILNYWVHFYTFWDSFDTYRTNDTWGAMAGPRLGRVIPNSKVGGPAYDFHCGNIPIRPQENTVVSSIRIKHYGYLREEDRQRKYEWYTKVDPNPNPQLVGHKDYKHLIATDHLQFAKWNENITVALTTVMKNEEALLSDFFQHILPFVDEVCLVDTGSTDASMQIAAEAGVEVLQKDFGDSFSKCRNFALENCKSTWALHMDIDEKCENLLAIRRLLDATRPDGFVFYIKNFMPDGRYTISETVRLMRKPSTWWYTGYVHETTDDCMAQLNKQIDRSPAQIHHFGYFRSRVPAKFKKYVKLNKKQMHDFPKDARPVFNLAMHYLEEPDYAEEGEALLRKAIELNPRFYSPHKELALTYLRKALEHFTTLKEILAPDHVFASFADDVIAALQPFVQPLRRLAPGHLDELAAEAGKSAQKSFASKEGGNGQGLKRLSQGSSDSHAPAPKETVGAVAGGQKQSL